MEEKTDSEKSQPFIPNLPPIKEDNEDSPFKITHNRTNSLEKMHYSKKIKRYIIPKIDLPSNYKIISTPHLQNLLSGPKASINDYEKLNELGAGSYAKVILCKSKIDGKKFAIKVIKKDKLNILYKQYEIHVEKFCLIYLSHPNIIKFNKSFQDRHHLYFVLEYCKNRDLY